MQQHSDVLDEPLLPYLDEAQRNFATYKGLKPFTVGSIVADDGTPLRVLELGNPDQPTVLLINALGVSSLFVTEMARRLMRDFHILTWESRGLPDYSSIEDGGDLSVERHCLDAAQVLAQNGRRADAVVSFCSGANIAVYAAAKQIMNPERLCIISPSMNVGDISGKTDYEKTMLPMWEKIAGSGPRYAALVRALLHHKKLSDDGSLDYELSYLNNLPFRTSESTYRYAQLQAACLRIDWPQMLGRITAPTLVFHGQEDDLIHVSTSRAVADGVPGATFRKIPDGHFAIYTCRELHDGVVAFLQGVGKNRT